MFNFTLHVCTIFHMVSIDVPASVGAPPFDTTSLAKLIPLDLTLHKIFFVKE